MTERTDDTYGFDDWLEMKVNSLQSKILFAQMQGMNLDLDAEFREALRKAYNYGAGMIGTNFSDRPLLRTREGWND